MMDHGSPQIPVIFRSVVLVTHVCVVGFLDSTAVGKSQAFDANNGTIKCSVTGIVNS